MIFKNAPGGYRAISNLGGEMNAEVEKKIKDSLVGGKLPCASAFQIAKEMKVSIKEIGETCNRQGIKLRSSQLGCIP